MGILNMRGLVKQVRGVSYKPSDIHDSLDDDSITLLRANNINDGQINFDDVVFVDRKNVSKEQILRKGDVLICASSGSKNLVGKAASVCFEREATFGAFCKVVRPNCQEDAGYIGMYFQSESYRREISSVAIGANINNIRNEHIDSLCLNWPNTIERQQAVQVMTKVDSIIRLRKSELNQLDDLIKARFVEMFGDPEINPKGWDKAPLKDHAEVLVGYPFSSEGYSEEGIAIIGGYNLMQGYIQWDDSKHWPNETGYEQYLLQENDIVMAMDRPWVNGGFKIARVDAAHLPALLIQRTACIRGKGLRQEFLHILLDSQRFAEHCNITGSLVPHISNKDINSFQVILPPMKLQNDFTTFVSQVDKSKFCRTEILG